MLVKPLTVQIELLDVHPATGIGVRLSATAFTGIVARDDGGRWEGAGGLELPFPRARFAYSIRNAAGPGRVAKKLERATSSG